jgi:hypothetical protein
MSSEQIDESLKEENADEMKTDGTDLLTDVIRSCAQEKEWSLMSMMDKFLSALKGQGRKCRFATIQRMEAILISMAEKGKPMGATELMNSVIFSHLFDDCNDAKREFYRLFRIIRSTGVVKETYIDGRKYYELAVPIQLPDDLYSQREYVPLNLRPILHNFRRIVKLRVLIQTYNLHSLGHAMLAELTTTRNYLENIATTASARREEIIFELKKSVDLLIKVYRDYAESGSLVSIEVEAFENLEKRLQELYRTFS